MILAARSNGYQEHQIHGDNKAPGEFEWPRYLCEISALCSTNNIENEIEQSLIKSKADKTAGITSYSGTLFARARSNSMTVVEEAQKDLCGGLSRSK